MPRYSTPINLNHEDDYATAWFMDFKLENDNHLGNIGEPPNIPGNYIYTHNQFDF